MTGRRREDGGQAAVELALVLPFVALLLLVVVQLGLIVADQVMVVHAAREAARQAAVDPSPDAAVAAAASGSGLSRSRLDVSLTGRAGPGSRVVATVSYRAPTRVPLAGMLIGDVDLRARAAMRVER